MLLMCQAADSCRSSWHAHRVKYRKLPGSRYCASRYFNASCTWEPCVFWLGAPPEVQHPCLVQRLLAARRVLILSTGRYQQMDGQKKGYFLVSKLISESASFHKAASARVRAMLLRNAILATDRCQHFNLVAQVIQPTKVWGTFVGKQIGSEVATAFIGKRPQT